MVIFWNRRAFAVRKRLLGLKRLTGLIGLIDVIALMGRARGSTENLREYGRVWLVGELGNFWLLGKLGQVRGNMKGIGKCVEIWEG